LAACESGLSMFHIIYYCSSDLFGFINLNLPAEKDCFEQLNLAFVS
jgi:hypothetical protein